MTSTDKKEKRNPRRILWTLLFFICGCLVLYSNIKEKNAPPTPTATPTLPPTQTLTPTETPLPTATIDQAITTLTPTNTPAPTATFDPHADFKSDVTEILGKGNRDVPRITAINFDDPEPGAIFINWALNDNLTVNMTGYGARSEASKILQALHDRGVEYRYIVLSGSFAMVDKFGNTTEDNIFNLTFNKSTVDKINWNNFLVDNVDDIADSSDIWPELRDN